MLAIATLISVALHFFAGVTWFGPVMFALLFVLPFFGVLITSDEYLTSGWRAVAGEWKVWLDLLIRALLSGVGFAVDAGAGTRAALIPWVVGGTGLIALLILRKRVYGPSTTPPNS